jgi:hypothetical protein
MSTQPNIHRFRRDQDIAYRRFQQVSNANEQMLNVMHDALKRIAEAELSLDGGIEVQGIAIMTLIKVNEIASGLWRNTEAIYG